MDQLSLIISSLFPAVVTESSFSWRSFPVRENCPHNRNHSGKNLKMIINPLKNRKSGADFLCYTCRPNLLPALTGCCLYFGQMEDWEAPSWPRLHTKGRLCARSKLRGALKKKWKWEPFPFPTKYKHDSRLHYEGSQHGKRPSVQVREQNSRLSCCSQAERGPLNNKYFSKPVQLWALAASSNRWRDNWET